MAHRIRHAMGNSDTTPIGSGGGVVEADATYIGRKKNAPVKAGWKHKRKSTAISTFDLFSSSDNLDDRLPPNDWPDADRFPINGAGRKIRDTLEADLAASKSVLIVTGYTSLDELIRFIGRTEIGTDVRLLFGNEPYPTSKTHHPIRKGGLPRQIRDHWIANGISVLTCGAILECLQKLDAGTIHAKVIADSARPLHAKIYVADKAATLGSSNFTQNGLARQLEANARFAKDRESKRYRELSTIAENFWQSGQDYTDGLKALLGELLRFVTWQEALARACSELLEGDWARAFISATADLDAMPLWPAPRPSVCYRRVPTIQGVLE
jgi:phosphatidylserine/phosphatidylglycerophosphate/cardiolipin synthase-like enzyme